MGESETSMLLPKSLKPKRSGKKVKLQGDKSVAIKEMKNLSLTSDEGIDISYSPLSPTITSIPPAILRPQHPLKTSWTFWYSVGNKNLSWEQNQVKISTVSTIEVWVKDASMMRGVVEVGRRVKSKLGLDSSKKIKFSLHREDKEGVKGLRLSL